MSKIVDLTVEKILHGPVDLERLFIPGPGGRPVMEQKLS